MGNRTWVLAGSSRRWWSIAAGVLVVAALAGCGSVKPEASGVQPHVSGRPAASAASGAIGATVSMPAVTASMPSSPAATHAKPGSSPSASAGGGGSSPGGGSGPAAGAGCVTSAQQNGCGPYHDPQIQGSAADPNITNDVWNPISGWQQTLYANSPGDWYTVVTGPTGNTAVVSYPDATTQYGDKALSSFPALYSSFSENMHAQSGTTGEAAYDLWLNNWNDEVMIMHDLVNIYCPNQQATVSFGGSHGVPMQQWKLCKNGSELIWEIAGTSEQAGSVDILGMLSWLVSHGDLPQGSSLTAIDYGFEVCSTGGRPERFQVNSYSVTT